jgi:hypothetical protein
VSYDSAYVSTIRAAQFSTLQRANWTALIATNCNSVGPAYVPADGQPHGAAVRLSYSLSHHCSQRPADQPTYLPAISSADGSTYDTTYWTAYFAADKYSQWSAYGNTDIPAF